MVKRRGIPDQRGMGAQSDFLGQTFIPDSTHRAEQLRRARTLLASGIPPEDVAVMLSIPIDLLKPPPQP